MSRKITGFQVVFPRFGDVFQHEVGATIGYVRSKVNVTGTAGQKLVIGDFLVMEKHSSKVATIPADLAAIKGAAVLGIYAGADIIQNINTEDPSYNHNVTEFTDATLTQEVVVIHRGPIGISEGGPVGTTKAFSGLKFPKGTAKADREEVHAKLIDQGFKILRQVS